MAPDLAPPPEPGDIPKDVTQHWSATLRPVEYRIALAQIAPRLGDLEANLGSPPTGCVARRPREPR